MDFDEELWQEMAVKSAEEIRDIETAMAITEQAVEVMAQHARPGVRVKEVVGRMLGAMVSAGSDLAIQLLLSACSTSRWPRFGLGRHSQARPGHRRAGRCRPPARS